MIHPPDPNGSGIRAVRDGQIAPVTCAACGCRMEQADSTTWFHFGRFAGHDARGCRVACVDLGHDVLGAPLAAVPA